MGTQNTNTEVASLDVPAYNGKEEVVKLYDTQLIAHTQTIQKLRDAGNMTILAIANELRTIDDDKSYEKAGFKSVAEYANIVFDYKRPTVALYIKAARAFITYDKSKKSIAIRDNLPNFTMGQMIELLPLVGEDGNIDEVKKAVVDGKINNRLSTKAIRSAVRGLNAIDGEVKSEEKVEQSATKKVAKIGDYSKDALPKNTTPLVYVNETIDAIGELVDNLAKAIPDTGNTSAEVMDMIKAITNTLETIRSNVNK